MGKQKTWADYDVGDPSLLGQKELAAAVRRAAKAANQRLVRLERAGATKGIYQMALDDLVNRKRFTEFTKSKTVNELRHEYKMLRSFISAKSSTVAGRAEIINKRYQTAASKGYSGSPEQFELDVVKYFADQIESLFSSDVIYTSITSGKTDVIDAAVKRAEEKPAKEQRGAALLYYLQHKDDGR